ncbi:MAG: CHAP domain-containing protein [Capsulimonas sp.]|uniref:CHAP domain-containing protein n=1 Tax=Capsulimonas sp. TaxID=2494211 RepID=UPI0032675A29
MMTGKTIMMSAAEKAARLQAVIAKATAYIGTKEDPIGSNRGRDVDRFLLAANCAPGNSWCMAFVVAMFAWCNYTDVNGVKILIPTASCQAQANHARGLGLLVSADDARTALQPGWVMLVWEGGGYHHAGIVTAYNPFLGTFETIEGNTNTTGGREGTCVARQRRRIRDLNEGRAKYAFIRTA